MNFCNTDHIVKVEWNQLQSVRQQITSNLKAIWPFLTFKTYSIAVWTNVFLVMDFVQSKEREEHVLGNSEMKASEVPLRSSNWQKLGH